MIDLRSDTFTKPTVEMRAFMMQAEVGDDVFEDDPTVKKLEAKVAALFGKEAALFVPSGTMSNQLCLNLLTQPGQEVIIDELGHVFNYETGAAALLSGIQLRTLKGDRGRLNADLVASAIRSSHDWDPISAVVALENTTNKGGGACYAQKTLLEIRQVVDHNGLFLHLDGARIWNAHVATGIPFSFFGSIADTLSVCFSKGLGAPVGSMLVSTAERVKRARRLRKMWGGGMRQVGILAAAADYALDHHLQGLVHDHAHAKYFAERLATFPIINLETDSVETNIVLFDTPTMPAIDFVSAMAERGVGLVPFGVHTVRATFHLDVDQAQLEQAIERIGAFLKERDV